ncbi:hypothetical protein B0H11DRAFT_1917560 [Mycena galericulata]|nr:hypothetical protein B0H11DRAFT_1917560 [Mycena galericulata]
MPSQGSSSATGFTILPQVRPEFSAFDLNAPYEGQFSNTRYPEVLDLGLSLFDAVRTIKFLRACHGHSTLILCRHIGKPFKRNSTGDNIVGSAGLHHAVKFHLEQITVYGIQTNCAKAVGPTASEQSDR